MIGIVSGAGPLAGLDVAKKIIEETKAEKDQDHLPVLLFSLPADIPDRSSFLLGKDSRNPGSAIGELFLKLDRAGATLAAIACNTAHAEPIFDEARNVMASNLCKLNTLHLIEVTVKELNKRYPAGTTVGVLSTDGTRQFGLYKNPLEEQGYRVIEADDTLQQDIQGAIYDTEFGIKSQSSPVTERAVQLLEGAMDELIRQGAEVLLLGCTELPLAVQVRAYKKTPILDPNRILARRLIELYAPEKLK